MIHRFDRVRNGLLHGIVADLDARLVKLDDLGFHELVKAHEFTLTLMDMRMPGLDGLETLKRVRQVRPSMKVVMITAYALDETVNELKKVGVEAILSKPIKFAELFEYLPLNS